MDRSPTPAPPRHDRETRRRLSGPGLRAFLAIADRWGLGEEDRRQVLGAPSPATYGRWAERARAGEALVLPTGVLMRLAAVLTVHRLLRQIFGAGPEALDWLRAPHDAPPLAGQPPLAILTGGSQEGLDTICRYLAALAQGHPAAPGPAGPTPPPAERGKQA
jgi:uncharacterized protein (DUF2384 family)